jgi:hypothetical protein
MKLLAAAVLSVTLLGAARNEVPIKEPVVAHESACDYAFDKNLKGTADLCLLAADEWSAASARHIKLQQPFYDLMGAMTRVQTAVAMRREGNGNALLQMDLAVTISNGVCAGDLPEFEIAVCNAIAREAVKLYPQVYKLVKPKETP